MCYLIEQNYIFFSTSKYLQYYVDFVSVTRYVLFFIFTDIQLPPYQQNRTVTKILKHTNAQGWITFVSVKAHAHIQRSLLVALVQVWLLLAKITAW